MESYTYCSDEAIEAIGSKLPEHYDMSLNESNMKNLLAALQQAWNIGNTWAGDFLFSIAETVTVEMI